MIDGEYYDRVSKAAGVKSKTAVRAINAREKIGYYEPIDLEAICEEQEQRFWDKEFGRTLPTPADTVLCLSGSEVVEIASKLKADPDAGIVPVDPFS